MPLIAARKSQPTEWFLARFVGHDRASAILGDLLEISATRGRLWFWTAYVRTLVTLGWRAPAAFLCTYLCIRSTWWWTGIRTSMHWLFRWVPYAAPVHHMPLAIRLQFLVGPLYGLYFLAPFAVLCFGLRDRLARLALVLFLATLPTYSNRIPGLLLVEILSAIVIVVALCLREWRLPLVVGAVCLVPRYAFAEAAQYSVLHGQRGFVAHFPFNSFTLACAVPAILCLWLHRRLLRPSAAIA